MEFEKSSNVENMRQNTTLDVIFLPFHNFPFVETAVEFSENISFLPFFRAPLKKSASESAVFLKFPIQKHASLWKNGENQNLIFLYTVREKSISNSFRTPYYYYDLINLFIYLF